MGAEVPEGWNEKCRGMSFFYFFLHASLLSLSLSLYLSYLFVVSFGLVAFVLFFSKAFPWTSLIPTWLFRFPLFLPPPFPPFVFFLHPFCVGQDWRILQRRHTFSLLASLFQSTSSATDPQTRHTILEILGQMTANPTAALALVRREGLLAWIGIQVALATKRELAGGGGGEEGSSGSVGKTPTVVVGGNGPSAEESEESQVGMEIVWLRIVENVVVACGEEDKRKAIERAAKTPSTSTSTPAPRVDVVSSDESSSSSSDDDSSDDDDEDDEPKRATAANDANATTSTTPILSLQRGRGWKEDVLNLVSRLLTRSTSIYALQLASSILLRLALLLSPDTSSSLSARTTTTTTRTLARVFNQTFQVLTTKLEPSLSSKTPSAPASPSLNSQTAPWTMHTLFLPVVNSTTSSSSSDAWASSVESLFRVALALGVGSGVDQMVMARLSGRVMVVGAKTTMTTTTTGYEIEEGGERSVGGWVRRRWVESRA